MKITEAFSKKRFFDQEAAPSNTLLAKIKGAKKFQKFFSDFRRSVNSAKNGRRAVKKKNVLKREVCSFGFVVDRY